MGIAYQIISLNKVLVVKTLWYLCLDKKKINQKFRIRATNKHRSSMLSMPIQNSGKGTFYQVNNVEVTG